MSLWHHGDGGSGGNGGSDMVMVVLALMTIMLMRKVKMMIGADAASDFKGCCC